MDICETCRQPIEPGTGVVAFDFFSDHQPSVHRTCIKRHWEDKKHETTGAEVLAAKGHKLATSAAGGPNGSRGFTLVELLVLIALLGTLAVVVITSVRGCSSQDGRERAIRAAEVGGLSNVRVADEHWIGATWHGCSRDDSVAYDVTGLDRREKSVDAVVCCGGPLSFKGCTLRVK